MADLRLAKLFIGVGVRAVLSSHGNFNRIWLLNRHIYQVAVGVSRDATGIAAYDVLARDDLPGHNGSRTYFGPRDSDSVTVRLARRQARTKIQCTNERR